MNIFLVILSFLMASSMFLVLLVVQVLLSRLKSAWPGLILPILFLLPGFIILMSIPDFMVSGLGLTMYLLPEIILTAIYFIVHRNRKIPTSDELCKMRAQDL